MMRNFRLIINSRDISTRESLTDFSFSLPQRCSGSSMRNNEESPCKSISLQSLSLSGLHNVAEEELVLTYGRPGRPPLEVVKKKVPSGWYTLSKLILTMDGLLRSTNDDNTFVIRVEKLSDRRIKFYCRSAQGTLTMSQHLAYKLGHCAWYGHPYDTVTIDFSDRDKLAYASGYYRYTGKHSANVNAGLEQGHVVLQQCEYTPSTWTLAPSRATTRSVDSEVAYIPYYILADFTIKDFQTVSITGQGQTGSIIANLTSPSSGGSLQVDHKPLRCLIVDSNMKPLSVEGNVCTVFNF